MKPLCVHCGERRVNRPRGLCWRDYYTPGVKELYPSASKYANRGVGNLTGVRAEPEPTRELPGTAGKFAELVRRAEAGVSLFGRRDARRCLK